MSSTPPDAELLIATGCAHCPLVLEALSGLIKEGLLSHLEITNIASNPQRARELGVRSVPWSRIGPFTLQGNYSPGELRQWAQRANSDEGVAKYIQEQLAEGQLAKIETFLQQQPEWLRAVIPLLQDDDTEMQVRLGIDAVLESMAGSEHLQGLIPQLGLLSQHENRRIRGDACHYLALTESEQALGFLEKCLDDEHNDVQDIAREGIEDIKQAISQAG